MTDRAVSVTVNYALNLVVATLLIAGLLTATAGMVENRRTEAVRSELDVVGQRLAADIQTADRLASAGGETVVVESPLPERVAGVDYAITVTADELVLETTDPRVVVRASYRTEHDVDAGGATIPGGDATVVRAGDVLEVRT